MYVHLQIRKSALFGGPPIQMETKEHWAARLKNHLFADLKFIQTVSHQTVAELNQGNSHFLVCTFTRLSTRFSSLNQSNKRKLHVKGINGDTSLAVSDF